MIHLCYLCLVFFMLSHLVIAALWSPAGKGMTSLLLFVMFNCASFVDLLCFCSVLCLLCFVRVCLYVLCGHLLGKGGPLGSRLWCLL